MSEEKREEQGERVEEEQAAQSREIYDSLMESPLYRYLIGQCEAEDKNRTIKLVEGIANQYDEIINKVRNEITTQEEAGKLLERLGMKLKK